MNQVAALEDVIRAAEHDTNALVYEDYGLTADERAMVDADRPSPFTLL